MKDYKNLSISLTKPLSEGLLLMFLGEDTDKLLQP